MFEPIDFLCPKPMSAFGMNVHVIEPRIVPVLELSETVQVTDDFREEMNAWLLEMFGTKELSAIPKGVAYMFGHNVIMRPETAVMITNLTC